MVPAFFVLRSRIQRVFFCLRFWFWLAAPTNFGIFTCAQKFAYIVNLNRNYGVHLSIMRMCIYRCYDTMSNSLCLFYFSSNHDVIYINAQFRSFLNIFFAPKTKWCVQCFLFGWHTGLLILIYAMFKANKATTTTRMRQRAARKMGYMRIASTKKTTMAANRSIWICLPESPLSQAFHLHVFFVHFFYVMMMRRRLAHLLQQKYPYCNVGACYDRLFTRSVLRCTM